MLPPKQPIQFFLEGDLPKAIKDHHVKAKAAERRAIGHQRFNVFFFFSGDTAVIIASSYFAHLVEDPSLPLYNW